MLQTRNGKRTAAAAVKIAVDMVNEGLITQSEAVQRVDPEQLDQLLHPTFDPSVERNVLATGLPASPGAASGKVVFLAEEAEEAAEQGEHVLLVRLETSPEDIGGMNAAQGILTARGGMTSHAAVVARGMGKCCVAGCGDLAIDYTANQFSVGDTVVKGGDWVSIDGSTGEVMLGQVPTQEPELSGDFATLMGWADEIRTLDVRTNADTPHDSAVARDFGAEGIGLCRTEHMFFEGDRINIVREMILADDEEGRRLALEKLLPIQRGDFEGIFNAMAGLPVTIRLLDPPLHEFLPHESEQQEEMARRLDTSLRVIQDKVESLNEFNPMLGHRGCRLGITYPEIYEMQVRAILEAAANVGSKAVPEIMIPLVGAVKEFTELKIMTDRVARAVESETGKRVAYLVGTMIEIPRARPHRRRNCRTRRIFLVWHQRPHANDLWLLARRRRQIPGRIRGKGHPRKRSLPDPRPDRRGATRGTRHQKRTRRPRRPQSGHLRRTRRRSILCVLLPQHRHGLRLLLALPRTHRPPRSRPRCTGRLISYFQ